MEEFRGKSVLSGVAIGKLYIFKKQEYTLVKETISDAEREKARFHEACEKAKEQLSRLYDKALADVGEDQAMIFDVHKMMLEDMDYLEAVEFMIDDQKVNAEFAANATGERFAEVFANMDDEYFKAWDYGPVIESIYKKYSYFASNPINIFQDDTTEEFEDNIKGELYGYIDKLSKMYPSFLVEKSHEPNSPWSKTARYEIISPELLEEYANKYRK